jgi:pyruvate formate lyase activating enzyme
MNCQTNGLETDTAIFFNIQRFSVHDGPGMRTILFAKGCPLHCLWCSNPESQKFEPEVAYKASNCIGLKQCGLCIDACPQHAIIPDNVEKICIDRTLCDNCGRCVDVCPASALVLFGKIYNLDELVKKCEEDSTFYFRSGGGLTISGGEPFAQPMFLGRLMTTLKTKGYHTTIETCGYFNLNDPGVYKSLKNTNLLLYDIKLIDPEKHKACTGRSNKLILDNIQEISKSYPEIEIVARTPIIPGINDTEEQIQAIAEFLCKVKNLKDYELLPFHTFGEPKYKQLGRGYTLAGLKSDSKKIIKLREVAFRVLDTRQSGVNIKGRTENV